MTLLDQSRERLPLEGVRILDLTRVLSGPFCTALMADLGAEVIKVEAIDGDDYRHMPPFIDDQSAFFLLVNRGKQSISINLKTEAGLSIIKEIASSSDVFVENFKPGVADRLGVGYEDLKEINPGLIYASISGFGQNGPLAGRPAYDIIVQAASGLMQSTGFADTPPTLAGEAFGDLIAGLFASWAVAIALFDRERTGSGRYIDVSMFDCLLSMLPTSIAQAAYGDQLPKRVGNRHPITVPFGTYRARDGYFVVAVISNPLFERLLDVIGATDLKGDERTRDGDARSRNEPFVREIIETWAAGLDVDEVLVRLAAKDVPAGPIWTIKEALASEQRASRQLVPTVQHRSVGPIEVLEQPVHFSGVKRGKLVAPPLLSEHADAILTGLCNLSPDAIEALKIEGVVGRCVAAAQ